MNNTYGGREERLKAERAGTAESWNGGKVITFSHNILEM